MKITMRLYRLHDLDLLYLYKMPNVSIQKIIKIVLKNYVRDRNSIHGISERVIIPHIVHEINLPQSALLHIYLNEGEDDEVIEWINQIPKGVRNSMLKNILRGYVNFPITIPYETNVENNNTNSDNSKQSIHQLNKDLGKTKNKPKTTTKKPVSNKKVIDQVLDAPLNTESNNNIITEQGNKVLNVSPEIKTDTNNEKKEINESLTKQNPATNSNITNTNNSTLSAFNDDQDDAEETDVFDDFESMMNDF